MGRPERYGLGARRFVAYGGCRCVAATDGGLPLASILFPSLPLGETHARAAVRAQEWVGERRAQSETHSLIRTHAISRSIFYPLRLSVMLRSGLHWRSIRSIAAVGGSKISSPLYC